MEFYDLAVLGATFSGVGAAAACEGKSIVFEHRQQIGYEFINSFNYGVGLNRPVKTVMGQKLKAELLKKRILSEKGLVHLPAVAPMICKYVIERGIKILLMTDVVNIEKFSEFYEITIYSVSGFKKIRASKVLNTIYDKNYITDKYINARISCADKGECALNSPEATAIKGLFSGEYVLKYKVDTNDDIMTARKKLHDFWRDRQVSLKPWMIAAVADCFEVKVEKMSGVIDDSEYYYLFSAAFDNFLQAFEGGAVFFQTEGRIL